MKTKLVLSLTLFVFPILFVSEVNAIKIMRSIAVNESTGECADYQYSIYEGDRGLYLKMGWVEYSWTDYPMIQTPLGDCDYSKGSQSCCEELGLKYVHYENATSKVSGQTVIISVLLSFLIVFVVLLVLIRLKKRKNKRSTG